MDRRQRGQWGEEMAAAFLQAQGYEIVGQHFCCRFGEIDVIARDGQELVFVEVKTRCGGEVPAEETVIWRKQQRLIKTAQVYLSALRTEPDWRIDVVGIELNEAGYLAGLAHVKGAFEQ